jgi:hypothetical protein
VCIHLRTLDEPGIVRHGDEEGGSLPGELPRCSGKGGLEANRGSYDTTDRGERLPSRELLREERGDEALQPDPFEKVAARDRLPERDGTDHVIDIDDLPRRRKQDDAVVYLPTADIPCTEEDGGVSLLRKAGELRKEPVVAQDVAGEDRLGKNYEIGCAGSGLLPESDVAFKEREEGPPVEFNLLGDVRGDDRGGERVLRRRKGNE